MATTGFWPVKGRLKQVIDYANNPDKTTEKKYLDQDLYNALRYAENDKKTDQRMYVSAINCPVQRAYERMMATKQRFGKSGGNVAYHGYQSFPTGEVTPEEAHAIGLETARRMWGEDYEIVVTTHLNTENIHNHMVINSVSFRTGRKFENHIRDHYRLREISDEVCREHGKSVLSQAPFRGDKSDYWTKQNGGFTRRDILREDIDYAIACSITTKEFYKEMRKLGYDFQPREGLFVTAHGWKRPIHTDSLGENYSEWAITQRILRQYYREITWQPPREPLLELERKYRRKGREDCIDIMFNILESLLRMALGIYTEDTQRQKSYPLSPEIRRECVRLDHYSKQNILMGKYQIHTDEDLKAFQAERETKLAELERERYHCRNRLRRPKPPEEEERLRGRCREISDQMKPLREELRLAYAIEANSRRVRELLDTERQMELEEKTKLLNRNKERSRER